MTHHWAGSYPPGLFFKSFAASTEPEREERREREEVLWPSAHWEPAKCGPSSRHAHLHCCENNNAQGKKPAVCGPSRYRNGRGPVGIPARGARKKAHRKTHKDGKWKVGPFRRTHALALLAENGRGALPRGPSKGPSPAASGLKKHLAELQSHTKEEKWAC